MTKTHTFTRIITASAALATVLAPVAAFAQDASVSSDVNASVTATAPAATTNMGLHMRLGAGASTSAADMRASRAEHMGSTSEDHMQKVDAHAGEAIQKRIDSLNQAAARISAMKLLPADEAQTLSASITAEIQEMTALKAKIDADTDPATLKADAQSITKSYRIYMLVIPQDRITSAADRILAVATQMQSFSAKLASRISAAGSVDASVTSAKNDFDAKVADAQSQAKAAVSLIATLKPDNGDKGVMDANTVALKSAAADIRTAQEDLKAARQDANIIVKAVAGKPVGAGVSSTTTASTSAQ